jgi:hypothetical protein
MMIFPEKKQVWFFRFRRGFSTDYADIVPVGYFCRLLGLISQAPPARAGVRNLRKSVDRFRSFPLKAEEPQVSCSNKCHHNAPSHLRGTHGY